MWITVRGGDLNYGLGWWMLVLALATATLPFIWPTTRENRQTQRSVALIALAAGAILVLYVLVGSLSAAAIGIMLVAVGYVLLWIGAVREYLRPIANSRLIAPGSTPLSAPQ
jgi:threonine/homoserine efflux transporter RhtA